MLGEALLRPLSRAEVMATLLRLSVLGVAAYLSIRWVGEVLDPTHKQKARARKRAEQLMRRMGVAGVSLTEYETGVAAHLVDPRSITVSWRDVAGLGGVVAELQDLLLPLQKPLLLRRSRLLQPPRGVLLYGPPGCGKTLLARASARGCGCRFLNLRASALSDQWYGETQKLTAALFSLAVKLQPCIIFIDEIDSLLRSRCALDHEVTALMKAQFMSLWDGLETASGGQVVVMGATNRPQDVDPAILRRMPSALHVPLPNAAQREEIIRLMLSGEKVGGGVDLRALAGQTQGFSGSDLRELCRDAAMYRVRDYVRKQQMKRILQQLQLDEDHDEDERQVNCSQLRPVSQLDLLFGLDKMRESKRATIPAEPRHLRERPVD